MSCSVISPVHQNGNCSGNYVCCACPTTVTEPLLPSVQSFAMALVSCCGQDFVPVLLVDQCGVTLVESDEAFARDVVVPNCKALPFVFP